MSRLSKRETLLRGLTRSKHDWKKTMNKKILERIKKLERRIP
jgi:hypothetical protein